MCQKSDCVCAGAILLNAIILIAFTNVASSARFSLGRETEILGSSQDRVLKFTELTAKYGYNSEEYKVITDDGYILTIFRLLNARKCQKKIRSPPVLFMHGLLQSSDSWIDSGPNSGLAYLISDACYDFWFGNVRGNYYSRHHVRLDPDKNPEFWNFDIEKIGIYDIPAMIDFVLDFTKSKKLNYIGFSQGVGVFLVMCSERPEYCDKVQLCISIAPATRHLNSKSIIFRAFSETLEELENPLSRHKIVEVLPKGSNLQQFLANLCQIDSSRLCETFIGLLDHVDSLHLESISNATLKVLFGHFPAGTSLHNVARYGQSMRSSEFEKYNYGKKRNLVLYGSKHPPIYNLSAVTVPVVCIYGINDGIVDAEDVKWLTSKLPNVMDSFEVDDPLWTHLDMTYSQYTKEKVFPKISEYLFKYSHT